MGYFSSRHKTCFQVQSLWKKLHLGPKDTSASTCAKEIKEARALSTHAAQARGPLSCLLSWCSCGFLSHLCVHVYEHACRGQRWMMLKILLWCFHDIFPDRSSLSLELSDLTRLSSERWDSTVSSSPVLGLDACLATPFST